jgi:hypothetical protein
VTYNVVYAQASKGPDTRFFGLREGFRLKQRGSIPGRSLTPGPSPYESTHMERGEEVLMQILRFFRDFAQFEAILKSIWKELILWNRGEMISFRLVFGKVCEVYYGFVYRRKFFYLMIGSIFHHKGTDPERTQGRLNIMEKLSDGGDLFNFPDLFPNTATRPGQESIWELPLS